MAEIKWIKLSVNMLTDTKIKLIRAMNQGNDIALLWIQILMKSTENRNQEGVFFIENYPYIISEMSDDKPLIATALNIFAKFEMVDFEGRNMMITDFERYAKVDRDCVINHNKMRDLRKVVLERDNFTCVYCGTEEAPFEVDHVIPRAKGGLDILENLVCACRHCNRSKKDKLLADWR